jgi:hypothetical protein
MEADSILESEPSVIAERNWDAYQRLRDDGHAAYVEQAKLYDRYYVGGDDQWDPEVIAQLDKERRPHHTANLVLSTVNAAVGAYISQRQDIHFKPVSADANEATARILTKLVQHISYDSHSRWVEKQVVMDGFIQDRGFFEIRLDTAENLRGEIRECALDPVDVLIDAGGREYDPRTWQEVIVTKWLTPDQVAATYGPEAADHIRFLDSSATFGSDSAVFDPETFSRKSGYYSNGSTQGNVSVNSDWKRVRRIRVICRQYYKFTIRRYFVDNITGDTSPVPDHWPLEKANEIARAYNLSIIHKPERRIRWTHSCDKFLLFDGWSPYRRFNIIPYFPYFRRGRPFGIVRNLISPQDLLNKTLSQQLHVVNTTANSGWMIQSGSLVNMTVDELRQVGAKTGLVIEYSRGSEKPEKITPNQIPTGLDRLSEKATIYFREISGITDAMLGQPGREISGEALQRKQQASLLQLDTVFDNLAYTRQLRAEFILELIQDFYTEERIFKIIGYGEEGEEIPEEVHINIQQATGEILNDVTVGEYKVVISSRPTRDVQDETEMDLMLRMREAGVMIPDWAIIERSPLENRREIAEWNRRITGAAEPTPEEIEFQQMQQELLLRRQLAEIDEIAAKTQERLANAQKILAEAEAMGQSEQMEIVKFGAQLRRDMEKDLIDLQAKREELLARIEIARQKNESVQQQAILSALVKRLDTESKERIAKATAQARAVLRKRSI